MCPLPVTKEQRLFCRRKRQWSQSSRTLLVNVVTGGSELWFKLKFILLAEHSATNPCSLFPIWERTWCARGLTLQISGLICGVGIENKMNIEGYTFLIQIFLQLCLFQSKFWLSCLGCNFRTWFWFLLWLGSSLETCVSSVFRRESAHPSSSLCNLPSGHFWDAELGWMTWVLTHWQVG